MSAEVRKVTRLNAHGVKEAADMWRTFNGAHYLHWIVEPTKQEIKALRDGGVRCRHIKNEVRMINDLFVHEADQDLASQIDARAALKEPT